MRIKWRSKTKMAKKKILSNPKPITPGPGSQTAAGTETNIEFEKQLNGCLALGAAEEEPKKRGPGRPTKAESMQQEIQLTETAIRGAVALPFELWSQGSGVSEMKLSDSEAGGLAKAVQELLAYYLPHLPASVILWCNFSLNFYIILSPRLALLQNIRAKKAEQAGTVAKTPAGTPAASYPQKV